MCYIFFFVYLGNVSNDLDQILKKLKNLDFYRIKLGHSGIYIKKEFIENVFLYD